MSIKSEIPLYTPSAVLTPQTRRAHRDGSDGTLYGPYSASRCRRQLPPENRRKVAEKPLRFRKTAETRRETRLLEIVGSSAEFTPVEPDRTSDVVKHRIRGSRCTYAETLAVVDC